MSDVFNSIDDDLDNMNLDNLFADPKEESVKAESKKDAITLALEKEKVKNKDVKPEDCLYDKTYKCPVCESEFKARSIRKGKSKFIGTDLDLRSIYTPVNSDYYDVIQCNCCGYTAISSTFRHITEKQIERVADNISIRFTPKNYPPVYTTDVAIERYKMALLTASVKPAKDGEKAYICLKIAWLYREKKDVQNEVKYLKLALEGFNKAFTNENFPICGLEENTLLYILSTIQYRLGNKEESKRILGRIIVKRDLSSMIKQKAEDFKELIKAQESAGK